MKNEEYLLRLSRVMEKIKDDIFVNFINELFHKVSDNYDLLDTKDLPCKSPNPGEGKPFYGDDLLDQLKASRIWFIQMSAKFGYTEDIAKFTEIMLHYRSLPIVNEFATGWIIKNLGTTEYLRDAILEHPIYTDFEKIWRWYDYANIDNIQKMGMPCFYSSDRYTPLSNIYCDSLQLIELIDDDLNFKENNIINFLFTFDPVNDTEKTAVIKHKLIFSVYFYIFVTYPRFMTEWAKSVKNGVVYEIYPSLLASMLYAAMNDSMVEVTPHTFIYPNINDFNDAIEAIMDYCYDVVSDIDDSLSDIYYEYLDAISDNLKIKRKSLIK